MEEGEFSAYLMEHKTSSSPAATRFSSFVYSTLVASSLSWSVLLGTPEAAVPRTQINLDYFQRSKSSYIISPISVVGKCHSLVVIIALLFCRVAFA